MQSLSVRIVGLLLLCGVAAIGACTFSVDLNKGIFQCNLNADCPAGFRCERNRCLSPDGGAGTCQASSDCPSGQACVQGLCQAVDSGPSDSSVQCTQDSDCPSGYCVEGQCYAGGQNDRCRRFEQCQSGFICQDLFGTNRCLKRCEDHAGCRLEESCRPGFTNGISLCVPRCSVVSQEGCLSTQACVLYKGRGYCKERSGKSQEGLQCQQDADCELNLYCRPVKGFDSVRRCTKVCDTQRNEGCTSSSQSCIAFPTSQGNFPFGYCEPLPREGSEGDICGRGDLICKAGLTCKQEDPFSRCRP